MPRTRPRVCRRLFERPEPGEVDKFLQEANEIFRQKHEEASVQEASVRWNFDFEAGHPMTSNEENHQYEWTLVCDLDAIPSTYSKVVKSRKRSEPKAPEAASANVMESTSTSNNTAINNCASSSGSSATAAATAPADPDSEKCPPSAGRVGLRF